jgi:transposase
MPRSYKPEFRRRVLDLVATGNVGDVARDLGVSSQTIYNWRTQDRSWTFARPQESGSCGARRSTQANRRTRNRARGAKRANELLRQAMSAKGDCQKFCVSAPFQGSSAESSGTGRMAHGHNEEARGRTSARRSSSQRDFEGSLSSSSIARRKKGWSSSGRTACSPA